MPSSVCNITNVQQPQPQQHQPQQQQQQQQQQSGLDHLVEAATALTQLVRTANVPKTDDGQQQQQQREQLNSSHQISDDEESKSKQSQTQAQTHAPSCTPAASTSMEVTIPLKLPGENVKEIFPRRLHRILADPTISDIITWLPRGNAFVILRTDELAESVLPRYFPESCASAQAQASASKGAGASAGGSASARSSKPQTCKYPSFTRKLNRWGFRQITRGQESGAFHHKFFTRDDPDLCLKMVCQRSRRRKPGKGNGVTMDDIRMRPAAQVLGPYSAVLRQPVADGSGTVAVNLNGAGKQLHAHALTHSHAHPTSSITDCDSDTSMNAGVVALHPNVHVQTTLNPKKDEDQATIVSSRSCNTPPPNFKQQGSSVSSLLSPVAAGSVAGPNSPPITITGHGNEMARSVSNCSAAPQCQSNTMNINMSFPIFTTNNAPHAQVDPRVLLQHNMATSANAVSAAATLNQVIARAGLPQMQQQQHHQPAMPSFITLLDPKTVNQQHSHSHTQAQLQPKQAPAPSHTGQGQLQVPANATQFSTQLLPVGAPAMGTSASGVNTAVSIQSTLTTNSSNSTVCSSNSNNSGVSVSVSQQQQQLQTEAQLRVANAKNMLYSAFLQALG